jgi:hypothetical protein
MLFIVSFVLRWFFADGDFFGDEAWYFYLAKSFGLEPGAAVDRPWFHLANRPLYYLFFHPATYGGLLGFRLLGCAVGALTPALCFLTARALGAGRASAVVMSIFLAIHRQHLEHSAFGFPDLLAADLALAACWAAGRGRARATLFLSIACVLSKESFVVVPVIATWLRLASRERPDMRPDTWAWLTVALPVAFVAGVTAISLSVPGVSMQGWSSTPFTLRHARNMWVGPELWPIIAWLAYRREVRVLVLWLGLPAFYLGWSMLLGRGLAPWYVIGPSALSAVAAALMLDRLHAEAQRRHWPRRIAMSLTAAGVLCLAPVPLLGALRVRAQVASLHGELPWPSAAPEVRAVIAEARPASVLLVSCFWSFGYSHLRAANGPASRITWSRPDEVPQVSALARAAELTVVCRDAGHALLERELAESGFDVLLEDPRWLVLRPKP